uniref:Uncharacterized protein n=1 Tax=Anguilla anguilla TaxID=7936 RepID=A0A0E9PYM2_ANGAN
MMSTGLHLSAESSRTQEQPGRKNEERRTSLRTKVSGNPERDRSPAQPGLGVSELLQQACHLVALILFFDRQAL